MPPNEADLGNDDLAVSVADDGLVIRATIDRADKRNALNKNVLQGLLDVCEYADGGDARVVVIRGDGPGFSSGGDFTEMPIGGTAQEYREGFSGLSLVVARLRETAALTVAGVEGFCLAGGLGLAAACDFVVAAEDAAFGTPEVQVGLFPAQAMVPIMRTVHDKRGLKLLFTGEKIPAGEAHEMGLVTDVYEADGFDEALEDFVDTLAGNSPVMVEMGKEAFYEQREMDFDRALAYAKEVIALLAMSEDTEEGIEAFMMDREPEWRGR